MWFVPTSFSADTDRLKNHKKQEHWEECERIKCIVFEERIFEREWIPTDNIFPTSESQVVGLKTELKILPDEINCSKNDTATVSLISSSYQNQNQEQDQDLQDDDQSFMESSSPLPSRSQSPSSSQPSAPTKPKSNSDPESNLNSNFLSPAPPKKAKHEPTDRKRTTSSDQDPKLTPFVRLKRLTQKEIMHSATKPQSKASIQLNKNTSEDSSSTDHHESDDDADDDDSSVFDRTYKPSPFLKWLSDGNKAQLPSRISPRKSANQKQPVYTFDQSETETESVSEQLKDSKKSETECHRLHNKHGNIHKHVNSYIDKNVVAELEPEIQSVSTPTLSIASPNFKEIIEIHEPPKQAESEEEKYEKFEAAKSNDTKTNTNSQRKSKTPVQSAKNIIVAPSPTDHDDLDIEDVSSPPPRTRRTSCRSNNSDNQVQKINYCEEENDNQSGSSSSCTINSSENESDTESGVTSDSDEGIPKKPIPKKPIPPRTRYYTRLSKISADDKLPRTRYSARLSKISAGDKSYSEFESDSESEEEDLEGKETENRTPLSNLTLLEWLGKQRAKGFKKGKKFKNKILLHPDPLSVVDFELEKNPLRCGLCGVKLSIEEEVKNHAENCWLHNKHRHVHCLTCNKHFRYPTKLVGHVLRRHCENSEPNLGERSDGEMDGNWIKVEGGNGDNDNIIEDSLPLFEWIQKRREEYADIILLDSEPQPQPMELQHASALDPVQCLLCTKSLATDSDLKIHVANCWTYNKDSHRYCPFCKIRFFRVSQLESHRRSFHLKCKLPSSLPIHCLECNSGFRRLKDFRKHEKSAQRFYQAMRGVTEPERVRRWSSALYIEPKLK